MPVYGCPGLGRGNPGALSLPPSVSLLKTEAHPDPAALMTTVQFCTQARVSLPQRHAYTGHATLGFLLQTFSAMTRCQVWKSEIIKFTQVHSLSKLFWKPSNISHFPGYWLLSQISQMSWTVALQSNLQSSGRFIQNQSSHDVAGCCHTLSSDILLLEFAFALSGLRLTLLEGEKQSALKIMPLPLKCGD